MKKTLIFIALVSTFVIGYACAKISLKNSVEFVENKQQTQTKTANIEQPSGNLLNLTPKNLSDYTNENNEPISVKSAFGLTPDFGDNVEFDKLYSSSANCGNAYVFIHALRHLDFDNNTFRPDYIGNSSIELVCKNNEQKFIIDEFINSGIEIGFMKCTNTEQGYKFIVAGQCAGNDPNFCPNEWNMSYVIDTNNCTDEMSTTHCKQDDNSCIEQTINSTTNKYSKYIPEKIY